MNTLFHQPKNTMPRIEEIYAYLSTDPEDGNEGVIGVPIGPVGCMPMIAADKARLTELTPIAEKLAKAWNINIRLVKFTKREEIGFVTP